MQHILIQNGTIVDGSGGPSREADMRVRDGVIDTIGPNLSVGEAKVLDASGLLVVPGLIDLHVHVFNGVGQWAIDPEHAGLRTGVTTVLDTGTAGTATFDAFHRYIIKEAEEDIFVLLNISTIGCLFGHPDVEPVMGELIDPRYFHISSAVECIKKYPHRVVGMKVRLSSTLADNSMENEQRAFHDAREASVLSETFLMVHHAGSNVPTATMLDGLRQGDVMTHLYHPHGDSPFERRDKRPSDALRRARERGVVLDVGHGVGAFSWPVAEAACQGHDFWPDTISTDIHAFNENGPVHDLPTTMSKFLHLGMSLPEVIRASTRRPAEVLGIDDRFGLLDRGRQADITLLRVQQESTNLYDVRGQSRTAEKRLVPVSVLKRGVQHECRAADIVAPSPDTWWVIGSR